jgi:uncharacterized protein (DUF488 family)
MEIATIGFTKYSAEVFFGRLKEAGIQQVLDVRAHNVSQLAGFAKRDDLRFFLRELCEATYQHEPLLAPTEDLLRAYRSKAIGWADYEKRFLELMDIRAVAEKVPPEVFSPRTALLCSEHTADRCHRRLVAEFLRDRWADVSITHL